MVLMIDRSLAGTPLAMSIWYNWVLGKNATKIPVEQVGVVDQSLGVEGMIVHHERTSVGETTAKTTNDEKGTPDVCDSDTYIEVPDW